MERGRTTSSHQHVELAHETAPAIARLNFPLHAKCRGVATDPEHFRRIDIARQVLIPVGSHPGAFGVVRKHHIHEGVDLYCEKGEPVFAMECGVVVAILDFTGPSAGSPWWLPTQAVMVAGPHGVINYGELKPDSRIALGTPVSVGDPIGTVQTVLRKDKGRPRTMLHLELYEHGIVEPKEWPVGACKPHGLLDPTELLLRAAGFMP